MKQISSSSVRNIVIVFLVIGIVFLALGGILRPILGVVMDPFVAIQRWLSQRFTAVYDFFTLPRDVTALIQENEQLTNEVSRLQTQVIQLQEQLQEAEVLYSLLDFARSRPEDDYIAAAVIGRDPSPFLQYVIIDHGSDDGIRHGMPVVTQQGLVGRVDAVTASAARIQLISDSGAAVNIRIQNKSTDGQVQGSVTGDLVLEMIGQKTTVNAGDIVLTSGLGGNFPADVLVGQVLEVRRTENELFQTASIQPAVDFITLRAVLVVANFQTININPLIPTQVP